MKYAGYEVCPSYIQSGSIKWALTGNGEYIVGQKNENLYFIKRNLHIRYPSNHLPKNVFEKYKEVANQIMNRLQNIKSNMSLLNWRKDCILTEVESFWDEDHRLVTVTPFISDLYVNKINNLNINEFKNLILKTAILLNKLHKCDVIHGDIKEQNILIDYNLTPYLIDFDSSYTYSDIPNFNDIGGTEGYLSPEILLYQSLGDEKLKAEITERTDVFSLGIVFYRWWTALFPSFDLECSSLAEARQLDKEIFFDKKFNVTIGPKHKATLLSLINWMTAKDHHQRASIEQVIEVLKDERCVDEEFQVGSDFKPFDKELWKPHNEFAELLDIEQLKEKKIFSFKRNNEKTGSFGLNYLIVYENNFKEKVSILELIEKGLAKKKPLSIDIPWETHHIEFISEDDILKKGIQKIKRIERQRYRLTDINGREYDCGINTVLKLDLIVIKETQSYSEFPWEEHGIKYDVNKMNNLGIKEITRVEILGEHKYKITYKADIDNKSKVINNVSINNMKLMGLIL